LSDAAQIRDYQQEAIDKAAKQQRGIIKAATGAGKTFIGSGIVAKLSVSPFIFYVTSQDLLQQAKDELERFLLFNNQPMKVGIIGGGICDIREINIMTVQTAVRAVGEKYKKYDEEDDADDNNEYVQSKYGDIANLIHSSKALYS
jgi:superfamily II DNA or RNA helicase